MNIALSILSFLLGGSVAAIAVLIFALKTSLDENEILQRELKRKG